MDERDGWATALAAGVDTSGTVALVRMASRNGQLTGEEAIGIVDDMIDAGWYCATDRYTRVLRTFRELGQTR